MKYVVYKRVSTQRQSSSGLGLEAQETAVQQFLKDGDEIALSFTEVESGRKNDRPKLKEALQACIELDATLLVAKIDRLSRDCKFLFTILDSKVKIKACDFPEANELTIKIMAVIAEWEVKRIQTRIKEALGAKKQRGHKLGKPENFSAKSRQAGNQVMKDRFIKRVDKIKFALQYLIKQEKKDAEIIEAIQGMYKECSDSFVRRAIKYVKATSTLEK